MKAEAVFKNYEKEIDSYINTRCITNGSHGMVYEINGIDGKGQVEVLALFPGVFLQFHNFNCTSFKLPAKTNISKGLKVSYCTEGRAEVRMSDNRYLFMKPEILSLDTRTAQNIFRFPGSHYSGVELFLHGDSMENDLPELLQNLNISPKQIAKKFCGGGCPYAVCADKRFKALFLAMSEAPSECRAEYLKIKITELLFLLQNSFLPDKQKTASFMTIGQVEIAKQIMEVISRDLGEHHSIASLAEPLGISASSAKNYFRGVYGKNISTYLREARMSTAAIALRDSSQPVIEIALAAGYENAGKFSSAFKKFFGETPLEYRRQSRCGI